MTCNILAAWINYDAELRTELVKVKDDAANRLFPDRPRCDR